MHSFIHCFLRRESYLFCLIVQEDSDVKCNEELMTVKGKC